MKKMLFAGLLLTALLGMLNGCGGEMDGEPQTQGDVPTATAQETVAATVPADGNPDDVTCKGSYTADVNSSAVVASVGDAHLTLGQLQVYYWAEVAAWRQEEQEGSPDFDAPLDTQPCQIDASVATWQQFFLRRALNTWHTAQALALQAEAEGTPIEEAYKPNLDNHAKYLTDIPATKYLYGYNKGYQPNTLHQAYLDGLPDTLEELAGERGYDSAAAMAKEAFGTDLEALEEAVALYNLGYMYFTTLSYYLETSQEETDAWSTQSASSDDPAGMYVDIRHILLLPEQTEDTGPVTVAADGTVTCSETAWQACREAAEELLATWQSDRNCSEDTFADLAYRNSQDAGTAQDGGAYHRLTQGQLLTVLDDWCFDEARESGDTVVLQSEYGCHILYYVGGEPVASALSRDALQADKQTQLLQDARQAYPMEVSYSAIALSMADGTVSGSDVLYPDVAHERFPEVPLYLQQDYEGTWFGGNLLSTTGCGITSFSMVASYLADDELTPPQMCRRYGSYSYAHGTDGSMFGKEAPGLGFYLQEKTYDPTVAWAALEEGHVVISVQSVGYWTRGGHYIVVEKANEDGTVQVRDSNIYNYKRISNHSQDKHTWMSVTGTSLGYWIFSAKLKTVDACARCGDHASNVLTEAYICHKCQAALLRRNVYLAGCGA